MSKRRFHLGWFTNFTPDEWNGPFSNGGAPWDGNFYVEMAQALERARSTWWARPIKSPSAWGRSWQRSVATAS